MMLVSAINGTVAVSVSQLANRAAMASRANAALAAHRAGRSGYPLSAVAALAASQLQSRRTALANAVAQANLAQANLTASVTSPMNQGATLSSNQESVAISAIPSVPVVSASPAVTSAGHNALTSNPLAAGLAAVAAQTQQPSQSHATSNITLQGLSQ